MAELDYAAMKEGAKAVWGLGDYREIAKITDQVAEVIVDACAISAGQEALDVAAGTGNVAVRAAAEGARVVASDLSPALIEIGRERTAAEGLDVEWVEADAEALPFEDASFDCVTSVFGAMFAPRPEVAAAELFRVVRPGGTVGMANWTPESAIGKFFALLRDYLPPPEGLRPPTDWGVEENVRGWFDGLAGSIEIERRRARWEFESVEALWEFNDRNAGPQVALRNALPEETYGRLRDDYLRMAAEENLVDDGRAVLEPEYLLVVARKRG